MNVMTMEFLLSNNFNWENWVKEGVYCCRLTEVDEMKTGLTEEAKAVIVQISDENQ